MSKIEKNLYSKLKDKKETFLSFDIDFLLSFDQLPCDLYLEIKKEVFKKVAHRYENLNDLDLNFVKEKKVSSLFVSSEEYFYGENEFKLELLADITDEEEKELFFSLFKNNIVDLGLSEMHLNDTLLIIDKLSSTNDSKMTELLQTFSSLKGSYLYNHSIFVSVLALSFLNKYKWDGLKLKENIVLSACFHDLGFSKFNHALFETIDDQFLDKLIYFIRDEIDQHAESIINVISNMSFIDEEIINNIKYHHSKIKELEKLDSTKFSRLNYLFYISHILATRMMKVSFNYKKIPAIIDKVASEFYLEIYSDINRDFKYYMKQLLTEESL